ncbi:carbohydrate-binding protein [Limibacter armeniacum]|uniref:carbohydrate-binding protein n=1 Tax=Limibacter armeniacum TaxID=466084 RepID=UPI002FE55855
MKRIYLKMKCVLIIVLALLCINTVNNYAQTVSVWLTKADQSAKLQQQGAISFTANSGSSANTITLDEQTTYQTIEGFGFALTQGSAQALSTLNSSTRSALLNELFNPTSGNAISIVRISIGASDLSNSVYTYNENSGDVNMNNFSLAGPDQDYLIPILQQILSINPSIKVLATPWTAPTWMKTNGTWIGGSLNSAYYGAYANYFVKYLDAMAALGINVWAITPQNEPENPYNEPSMLMNSTEQKSFINGHLGPAIAASGHGTKIIAFDHNCDNTAYPIDVLNGSSYVDGAAFHLYAGNISAMSTVRNQTGKNVYFTEQFTSSNGSFGGDLGWHMNNVVIGSLRNWSKSVIEWNLANNSSLGPKTPGGCSECLGAITVNGSSSFTRNVSYYIISQVSKFVQPGAVRFATNTPSTLANVAMKNPDGSKVLLVHNTGGGAITFKVVSGSDAFSYTLDGGAVVTFKWSGQSGGGTTTINAYSTIEAENYSSESGTQLESCSDTGGGQDVGWIDAGDYLNYNQVDFGSGAASVEVRMASDASYTGSIEFRLGSTTGTLIGTLSTNNTGGWQSWETRSVNVSGASGVQNLYLVFNGGSGIANLNWFKFNATPTSSGIISGATYRLVNRLSGKSLDVQDVSTANGARIQQWDWSSGQNQQWIVTSVGGGYYSLSALHSGKALDVVDVSQANGAEIQQWDWSSGDNQKWQFVDAGSGYFRLRVLHSNKVLDIENNSTANGAKVVQWTESTSDQGQQWTLELINANGNARLAGNLQKSVAEVSVFPNPSSFEMEIRFEAENIKTIEVYTIDGRLMLSKQFKANERILLNKALLGHGMFIARCLDGNRLVDSVPILFR